MAGTGDAHMASLCYQAGDMPVPHRHVNTRANLVTKVILVQLAHTHSVK